MGDPHGVSPLITWHTWLALRHSPACFFVYSPRGPLEEAASFIANSDAASLQLQKIDHPQQAAEVFPQALPVFCHADKADAASVINSIQMAFSACLQGDAAAMVTNPIHKADLLDAGFAHAGHTPFLGALARAAGFASTPLLMMYSERIKTVDLTGHIPLAQVVPTLEATDLVALLSSLYDQIASLLGKTEPRIVCCGVNPHAGEDGRLGDTEQRLFSPALSMLRQMGKPILGPVAADGLFTTKHLHSFDVALCTYHDQAMLPVKLLDFMGCSNITLGLPLLRASPGHGSARALARSSDADPAGLIATIRRTHSMAKA